MENLDNEELQNRVPEGREEKAERSREEELHRLMKDLKQCRYCEEEFGFESRPIQYGHPNARILHISQAPGRKVHEIGRPFSDLSGKTLRESWYQISDEDFYNPDVFYFTVMGHCFPGKGKGNYDRKPPRCCWERWTRREIELMDQCDLYLVVGQEAASRLFPGRKLADLVFEDLTLHGKPCFVLPHPSPLNRKWLKDHPAFEQKRLPLVRQAIHQILEEEKEKDAKKLNQDENRHATMRTTRREE